MRVAELSDAQRTERALLITALRKAGWEPTVNNQIAERGDWFPYEASFMHSGRDTVLVAEYSAEKQVLDLELASTNAPESLRLLIHFDGRLEELLNLLTSHQDMMTPANWKEHLTSIVQSFPETYLDRGEDEELVRLEP